MDNDDPLEPAPQASKRGKPDKQSKASGGASSGRKKKPKGKSKSELAQPDSLSVEQSQDAQDPVSTNLGEPIVGPAKTDESAVAIAPKARFFRLKPMVMARVLAEFTALAIMLLLPLLLLAFGKLFAFSAVVKLVFAGVALVAACVLPIYGFITFQVRFLGDELTSYSLFKRTTCKLSQITSLSRRSSFNWVRYVVSFDGGEFSFPVWLKHCDDLVALVRANLPAYLNSGGVKRYMGRTFVQDPMTACVQVAQVVLSLIFIGVVWVFTLSASGGAKAATTSGQSDFAMLVTFAAAASAVLFYRAYVVLLMPHAVKLSQDQIEIATYFYKRIVALDQLNALHAPLPLLPEGFVIKTTKGSFLIGTGMDSADELEKALRELVPERPL